MKKIGVIGCGNMASQIVRGLFKSDAELAFLMYTPTGKKAVKLALQVGGKKVESLSSLVDCDYLLLGCKPQQWSDLSLSMLESGLSQHKCISMLAATPFKKLKKDLPHNRFIRIMPNTPIGVGLGVTLMLCEKSVLQNDQNYCEKLFRQCSDVYVMDTEKMFDQVTTVSGCGPAYVYLFASMMSRELERFGMDETKAKELVITLFQGSSKLMKEASFESLDELISKVTSKGGVTIEAVNSFKDNGLEDLTRNALSAAFKRSNELNL